MAVSATAAGYCTQPICHTVKQDDVIVEVDKQAGRQLCQIELQVFQVSQRHSISNEAAGRALQLQPAQAFNRRINEQQCVLFCQ